MALVVNTNLASMNAINNLNKTTKELSGTFARLSSGLRINSAADDAAGLAVAENLESTRRAATVAARNANDGISMIQVAEGATEEITNMLQRMKELSIEAASETLADTERQYIDDEYQELILEIDRIAAVTTFNGIQVADGSVPTVSVHVGFTTTAADSITVNLTAVDVAALGLTGTDTTTSVTALAVSDAVDAALTVLNASRSTLGAAQNRLDSAINNLNTFTENTMAAESRIRDADFASETAELAKLQIIQQAGIAVLGQSNVVNQGALSLLA